MIILKIDGPPVPYAAPRKGKHHFYNPRHKVKEQYQWQIRSQWQNEPIQEPLVAEIICHMPIPKNTSKKRRLQMLNGVIRHDKKPDKDNLTKFVLDCIKGIVIRDDCQIDDGRTVKIYSEKPGTVIKLIPYSEIVRKTYEDISGRSR